MKPCFQGMVLVDRPALRNLAAALGLLMPAVLFADTTGNLLANPSFEEDWINAKAEKQLISHWGEHGFNQQDLKPDAWLFTVPVNPDERTVLWNRAVFRSGGHSIQLRAVKGPTGAPVFPSASQSQIYSGFIGQPGKDVFDSPRAEWAARPMTLSAADAPKFFRALRLSAWCRAQDVPEGSSIGVTFNLVGPTLTIPFPSGTYDWQQKKVEIAGAALAEAFVKTLAGKPEGPLPMHWTVTLHFTPPAANPAGTVWFDDIALEEDLPSTPNLASNWSFEEVKDGLPAGWSAQKKFFYVPPAWYYVWRDWSHFFSAPRGKVGSDSLICHRGSRSFRFSVLPGDEKFCESAPIAINQNAARPVEVGVWLKADKIRFFDLRAIDENGVYLNDQSFISGTDPNRETNAPYRGTFDWRYIRKFFVSDHPLKTIRVRLCARGFNGLNMDDVGRKATNNQVGTLWWDDLIVTDPLSGEKAQPVAAPPNDGQNFAVAVDFGERLYGENVAALSFPKLSWRGRPAKIEATMTLTPPGEEAKPVVVKSGALTLPDDGDKLLRLPYEIWTICPDWRSQYRMKIALSIDGQISRETEIDFGTWPEIGRVEVEHCYPLPDQIKNGNIWVNFGVTDATLAKVKALRYDFIRRGNEKNVKSVKVPDFPKVRADFVAKQPLMDWWVDEFHLYMQPFDLGFLSAHAEDEPVRDTKVAIVARDDDGKEIFRCESVPFGAVKPNTEKLDPVQTVAVTNGALTVNGKPFFYRACLPHAWSMEPAPSERLPWIDQNQKGPDGKVVPDFASVKRHGFNSFWPNTPYQLDYADAIWKANLYTGVWYPKAEIGLSFDDSFGARWNCKSAPADFEAAARHPSMLIVSLTAWEGGMHPEIYSDPRLYEQQKKFADTVRGLTHRPLFSSGGYSAHKQQYGTMWDVFGPESNWDGPSRVPITVLHHMRAQGKDVAGIDFPNIFNDCPLDLMRFETYEGIIRGQRGFVQIGRWGDNSLYRGINGELRYFEKFIFEPAGPPTLSVEPVEPETTPRTVDGKTERYLPKVSFMERTVKGRTYVIATNAQPIRQGDWTWTTENKFSGRRAHTGESTFRRIYPDRFLDWHVHGYRDDKPVEIRKGDILVQHVYIPADARVENLILMADGDGRWNYNAVWGKFDFDSFSSSKVRFRLAGELYRWLWSSFNPDFAAETYDALFERDFLRKPDFRQAGDLPEKGKWVKLSVPAETLGLVGLLTDGFEFLSKGAPVWWDYTAIERGSEIIVLCDDVLGASERELAQIRFKGLKPGARVRVPFEDREIKADRNGTFVDDFRGENTYDQIWEGMFGDKSAPEVYYGGGYHYNYPNTAVHIYEVQ